MNPIELAKIFVLNTEANEGSDSDSVEHNLVLKMRPVTTLNTETRSTGNHTHFQERGRTSMAYES